MGLDRFLQIPTETERSLVVLNRTEPDPLQHLLEDLFTGQGIRVEEGVSEQYDDDIVALIEDETVVATSALQELEDAILMVNSDLFTTGTRAVDEITVPAVIDGLTDHPFTLRGYPDSHREKILLILVSRHIERLACTAGEGTLRSSFQRLSRLEDERGTREVYETIAGTNVDVHLYGRPDWTPDPAFPVTIHGGHNRDFRRSWFVVFDPPADGQRSAVLLAIEQAPRHWEGFWTYRRDAVESVGRYIRQTM